jgi:hypothetical protein
MWGALSYSKFVLAVFVFPKELPPPMPLLDRCRLLCHYCGKLWVILVTFSRGIEDSRILHRVSFKLKHALGLCI